MKRLAFGLVLGLVLGTAALVSGQATLQWLRFFDADGSPSTGNELYVGGNMDVGGTMKRNNVNVVTEDRTVTGSGPIKIGGSNSAQDLSANRTWTFDSTAAGTLTDGGTGTLTCGSSNQGKQQTDDVGLLAYCDGATTSLRRGSGPIYSQSALASAITNTTTETSIVGTGLGTLTLPASYLQAGTTLRVTSYGYWSTDASAPGTTTMAVYLGSTQVCASGSLTPPTSLATRAWIVTTTIQVRTTGASGTVWCAGRWEYESSIFANYANTRMTTPAGVANTTTIDTTASQTIAVKFKWNTADADNTLTGALTRVEILN